MRVGVTVADLDHDTTRSIGIYNVALGLCRGLAQCTGIRHVVIRGDRAFQEALAFESDKFEFDLIERPVSGVNRVLWECYGASRWADQQQLDWLVFPKGFTPFLRPKKAKICAFVQDVMHDFYAAHYPECQSLAQKLYFPRLFRSTLKRADLIVTSSEFIRQEVVSKGRRDAVATIGIGFEPQQSRTGQNKHDVLIYLSSAPHKLSQTMIDYVARYQREMAADLRVCGLGNTLQSEIDQHGWTHYGRISDQGYAALSSSVRVVVYASEYEGYGMPPVERLISEQGVICSDIEPMASHIDPALLFCNTRYESFADALGKALARESWGSMLLLETESWQQVAAKLFKELQ
ncbi:MAG: hypothetical protein ACI9OU_000619 [Candidatus Promineifilaceae bacterium]|jgi:hypothetical protein